MVIYSKGSTLSRGISKAIVTIDMPRNFKGNGLYLQTINNEKEIRCKRKEPGGFKYKYIFDEQKPKTKVFGCKKKGKSTTGLYENKKLAISYFILLS